jgi:hypothetical protein
VSPAVLQRQAALAGAALLAGLLVVVLDRPAHDASDSVPPPMPAVHWETAVVSVERLKPATACQPVAGEARGVIHPVLPCGVKLVVSARGKELRVEVLERGPVATGRDFALTPALAEDLGVRDGDRIRWRFAG